MRRGPARGHLAAAAVALSLALAGVAARASVPQTFAIPATPGRIPHLFTMSAGSMLPTLRIGDVVGALELHGPPHRGDVVVHTAPRNGKDPWVKRIIGLPGETVQLKEGRLYIDDKLVPRAPIAKVRAKDIDDQEAEVPTYTETLPGGVAHAIIEIQGDTGFNDNTEPFHVPADSYFVMGDNRDNSIDSRVSLDEGGLGAVAAKDLIGRADTIFARKGGKELTQMPIH